jgi:hypothetical protein
MCFCIAYYHFVSIIIWKQAITDCFPVVSNEPTSCNKIWKVNTTNTKAPVDVILNQFPFISHPNNLFYKLYLNIILLFASRARSGQFPRTFPIEMLYFLSPTQGPYLGHHSLLESTR